MLGGLYSTSCWCDLRSSAGVWKDTASFGGDIATGDFSIGGVRDDGGVCGGDGVCDVVGVCGVVGVCTGGGLCGGGGGDVAGMLWCLSLGGEELPGFCHVTLVLVDSVTAGMHT